MVTGAQVRASGGKPTDAAAVAPQVGRRLSAARGLSGAPHGGGATETGRSRRRRFGSVCGYVLPLRPVPHIPHDFKPYKEMSEIADKVKKIIIEKLGVDESEVTPEASFTNDLGADSLDTVELIMEFEKEFNVSIPDDQAENIQTVGQAVSYLEEHAK